MYLTSNTSVQDILRAIGLRPEVVWKQTSAIVAVQISKDGTGPIQVHCRVALGEGSSSLLRFVNDPVTLEWRSDDEEDEAQGGV